MSSIFTADFSTCELTDWTVEQHVPDGYNDFAVRDNKLVFLDAGNRLLPNAPSLGSFVVKGAFDADWHINNKIFSFRIFFAYDPHKRQGLALDFGSDGKKSFVKLLAPDQSVLGGKELEEPIMNDGAVTFELEVKNRELRLRLNAQDCFTAKLDQPCQGLLAFTRGAFLGELRLQSLAVDSDDPLERKTLWKDLEIPFAPLNGMDIPIVWTVNAERLGDAVEVEVALSGGEKSRPDTPWFPYHCHYVEFLEKPYLRIESEDAVSDLRLTDATLVLAIPKKEYFYIIAHQNPPWPFKKVFHLRGVKENSLLFAGYKAYGNRAVNKHLETKSPHETVYDTASGKIIYAGQAVAPGAVVVELRSPAEKQLVKDIPKTTYEYDKAVASAANNHYFKEGESCEFHFELFSRVGAARARLKVEYRVENAFFDPLTDYQELGIEGEPEKIALDIERLRTEKIDLGTKAPSVYHLRFRLRDGAELLHENYRAFEVLGAAAARLPKCLSMSNEVKGQDTDNFDPWRLDCADVSHYISICAGIMPHFARERRFWELLKLYQREWFLWLGDRVMKDFSLDNNHDLVENCDYINHTDTGPLFRPCCRLFYHTQVLETLHAFAVENNFKVAEIKAALDAGTIPDKETFAALVNERFYQWVDFAWAKRLEALTRLKARISRINPNAKISSYGPVAVYGGIYKTAHALTYVGLFKACKELEALRDGYFMLEDYPHACRYSINSGPFFLASLKAIAPSMTVYPEMYNETGDKVPCPDAAVARAFPSYGMWSGGFPINVSMKRVLEYVYACAWHDGEKFNYWKDYGFHTRVWERERFEALLKLWGFVDKNPPKRPLKANAFVCDEDCCRNHKLYYDEYPGDGHEAFGDLFNTAEEASAYSYEMSRAAGQNAGFVTDFDKLSALDAADIDTLVLPPLTKVSGGALARIRRLHEQGVSLLAFEEVAGLEDLFGVAAAEPVQANNIKVNAALADNPLSGLSGLVEYTEHRACVGKYRATTARILLDAEIPVLFANETKWGRTALYNIPPTAVRRQDQFNRVAYGRASISKLVNESTKLVLRYLSDPVVETSEGKVIAFEDTRGGRHIILEEDAHPFPARAIHPMVTLNIPNLKVEDITSESAFTVVSRDEAHVQLRLSLAPDEFAIINL